MTASLPAPVQTALAEFSVAELTVIDRRGQPVTEPRRPRYAAGDPCLTLAGDDPPLSSPLVAVLFSDPAGCRLPDPPMVLVQGSAEPTPTGADELRIRPERVYAWPGGDITREPTLYDTHMEEVRSGHSEEPERYHAEPEGGAGEASPRLADLGARYPTAVLALVAPDGFPFAVRVPVQVTAGGEAVAIGGAPVGVPFQPGLACLTAYGRDDPGPLEVRGDLVSAGGAWELLPHAVRQASEGLPRLSERPTRTG